MPTGFYYAMGMISSRLSNIGGYNGNQCGWVCSCQTTGEYSNGWNHWSGTADGRLPNGSINLRLSRAEVVGTLIHMRMVERPATWWR